MASYKKCRCRLHKFARATRGTRSKDWLNRKDKSSVDVRKMALEIAFKDVKDLIPEESL